MPRYTLGCGGEVARKQYADLPESTRRLVDRRIEELLEKPRGNSVLWNRPAAGSYVGGTRSTDSRPGLRGRRGDDPHQIWPDAHRSLFTCEADEQLDAAPCGMGVPGSSAPWVINRADLDAHRLLRASAKSSAKPTAR